MLVMANLFPRRNDMFDWLPSFLKNDQGTSLFDTSFRFETPKVDVKDKRDYYEMVAEAPGFSKDDIVVEYKDGYLTIQGKKEDTVEEKDEQDHYVRRERSYGSFQCSFYVGDVDEQKITGQFDNGLLTLQVPKSDDAHDSSTYKIEIK